ncbi:hypothetical protein [Streptomyces sp. NRRL B-24720]|uniref:hypothetical protein n=1 Tax=Streptomyces sp. NRRL B-24720 TaxID=1476876 RepID=UPI0004C82FFD|nr:hypothetical protein [Streptomyces sp. NRRL B-24720]
MSARRELIRRLSEDSLGGIATLHDVTDAEQLLDSYRAEAIADRDAQIIAWLVKKAGEEGTSNKERRTRADVLFRMADKLSRGAVRPPLSKGPDPVKRGPLWSLLDWSFWGAGMGDTFREPLADAMLATVPAETIAQAEQVMAEFIERRKIEKTGVTVWQEQRDELAKLKAQVAELTARPSRAAVLAEAADKLVLDLTPETQGAGRGFLLALRLSVRALRRMADEAESGGAS